MPCAGACITDGYPAAGPSTIGVNYDVISHYLSFNLTLEGEMHKVLVGQSLKASQMNYSVLRGPFLHVVPVHYYVFCAILIESLLYIALPCERQTFSTV